MNLRFFCAAGCVLTLSACATDGTTPAAGGTAMQTAPAGNAAFRTADFTWSTAPGTGQIVGQLSSKAKGKVQSCVDAGVVLTPETPWVRSRMTILYASAERAALPAADVRARTPPERNQDYSAFVRRAACDASGKFTFTSLPNGAFYVITVARPQPAGSGPDMAIMRRVVVRSGAAVKVAL